MSLSEFTRLRDTIEADYRKKMDALFVLFPEHANPVGTVVKKLGRNKALVLMGDDSPETAPAEKEICDATDCQTRLRSDSKKCESCGKRVCSKHYDKSKDACDVCAAVPE